MTDTALPHPRFHLVPHGEGYVATTAVVVGSAEIGKEASVWYGAVVRADDDRVILGARSNLQDLVVAHPLPGLPMEIGEECVVGHGAILHLSRLGSRTLVGMGAILLGGAEIGEECIVAAGALVREGARIPPRSLVAGVPARIVRSVTDSEVEKTLEGVREYVEKARLHLAAVGRVEGGGERG